LPTLSSSNGKLNGILSLLLSELLSESNLSLASLRLTCRLALSFELEVLTQGKILGIASLFNLLTSATVPVKAKNFNF
jgi:hypothetical protein